MCGRYLLTSDASTIAEVFDCEIGPRLEARYNIAPTQPMPVIRIRRDTGARRLSLVHWGLIPNWAKGPAIGNRMINARAESASDKPAYRGPFKYHRCLIPADGFYEWKRLASGQKQPHVIRRRDGKPFAFAGLWDHWQDADGNELDSATILTTRAQGEVAALHERMPVILDPSNYVAWLDLANQDKTAVNALLEPIDPDMLELVPVGRWVNNPRHDDARCIEPAEAEG